MEKEKISLNKLIENSDLENITNQFINNEIHSKEFNDTFENVRQDILKKKKKHEQKIYKEIEKMLQEGYSNNEIMEAFPNFIKRRQQIYDLINKGEINPGVTRENKKKAKKKEYNEIAENFEKFIIKKIENGATKEEILSIHYTPIGDFLKENNISRNTFHTAIKSVYEYNATYAKKNIYNNYMKSRQGSG